MSPQNTPHPSDVKMSAVSSQITGVSIVYSTVCSGVDQRKHQSSASLVFVRRLHRWPVESPHKEPVTRKMLPFDDITMHGQQCITSLNTVEWKLSNCICFQFDRDCLNDNKQLLLVCNQSNHLYYFFQKEVYSIIMIDYIWSACSRAFLWIIYNLLK